MKDFILMNRNNPILNLEYDFDSHSIAKVNETFNLDYASPAMFDFKNNVDRKNLNSWWRNRSIPYSRNGLSVLLETVSMDSPLGLAEANLGLSLTDCYWLNDPNNLMDWNDINFFDNDFSEDLGLIILDGKKISNPDLMNPSGSVDGNLPKKWTIKEGRRVLVKGSTGLFAQEPYNEFIMSKLYGRLLNKEEYVPYNVDYKKNQIYSECPCMVDGTSEYIPMYDFLRSSKRPNHLSDYQWMMGNLEKTNIRELEKTLTKMFTCDFILANDDRHWRNFGLIRDVETHEYLRVAPFFDGGSSLWLNSILLNSKNDCEYKAKPFGPCGMAPKKQLKLFNDFSWFDPSLLVGFSDEIKTILSENPIFPQDRLETICYQVENKIKTVSLHAERCDINFNNKTLYVSKNSLESEAKDMSKASKETVNDIYNDINKGKDER